MFTAKLIAIAFFTMFVLAFIFRAEGWFTKRNLDGLFKALWAVCLIAGLYCVLAGIHLAGGWEDPFARADPETLGRASAGSRGRAGIIILAIRFWPWVLMGIGGWFTYNSAIALWNRRRR